MPWRDRVVESGGEHGDPRPSTLRHRHHPVQVLAAEVMAAAAQHEVPAVLMLITTEVAEAMEAFRHNDKANFAEELADVVIRTVGLSHGMDINLGQAIMDKMERNRTRAYQHGGKRI